MTVFTLTVKNRMAAYNFLIRRMLTLLLDREQQQRQWQTQQLPHTHVNPTQTQDTMEHLPGEILHAHTPKQSYKMGNIHLLITRNQKKLPTSSSTLISKSLSDAITLSHDSPNPPTEHLPPHPMTDAASTLFPA